MFGFKTRRKRYEATYITNSSLETAYDLKLGRRPPKDLAARLVALSWNPDVPRFLGQSFGDVGFIVHAAEALKAGYGSMSATAEEQSMSAHALMYLVGYWVKPENARTLSDFDHQYLMLLAQSAVDDPRLNATWAYSHSIPRAVV